MTENTESNAINRSWGTFTTMTPIMQTYPNGQYKGRDKNEIYTRTWNLGGSRVPVISGDSFRGRLRRAIVEDFLDRLGVSYGSLPVRVAHLLFVGGSLMNTDENTLDVKLAEIRHLIPSFALLGGTALGGFAQGRLCAGEWVAHSAQTPVESMIDGVDVDVLPAATDLIITQGYARNGKELYDMFSREELTAAFTSGGAAVQSEEKSDEPGATDAPGESGKTNEDGTESQDAVQTKKSSTNKAEEETTAGKQLHMPHAYQAVVPGTVFSGTVTLRPQYELTVEDDAVQRACLRHGINIIAPEGRETLIGARASCGWGVVRYEWEDLDTIASDNSAYLDFIGENGDAIRGILSEVLVPRRKTKSDKKSSGTATKSKPGSRPRSGTRKAE